jgi:tRNA-specific 2-thiouridylase
MRLKVAVALSGGVDSSVAALLLKQQDYDLTGIMLRFWSEDGKEASNRCCTPDAMVLARRVAARLDIPFHVFDAREQFRNTVVKEFLEGYGRGETPNPCVTCNRLIKWDFLLKHAQALGADYLASGHYARKQMSKEGKWQLLRGVDHTKDQSYVLHVLDQRKLGLALFPLGDHLKGEIRKLAEENGLPNASRFDSQDLCFLAGDDYRQFLRRHAPQSLVPGLIVDLAGRELGRHQGLAFYTIGQRKLLGVTSAQPLYVLAKDVRENRLVVASREELGVSRMLARDVTWISGENLQGRIRLLVKTRYMADQSWVEIEPAEETNVIIGHFDQPQRDLTPGQAAVFYDGDVVLGGGRIAPFPHQCE